MLQRITNFFRRATTNLGAASPPAKGEAHDTIAPADIESAMNAATTLVGVRTWDDLKALLIRETDLYLSDAVSGALVAMQIMMQRHGDLYAVPMVCERFELLQACRRHGLDAAFAVQPAHTLWELDRAAQRLVRAESPTERERAMREEEVLLLDPRIDHLLLGIAAVGTDRNEQPLVDAVHDALVLLSMRLLNYASAAAPASPTECQYNAELFDTSAVVKAYLNDTLAIAGFLLARHFDVIVKAVDATSLEEGYTKAARQGEWPAARQLIERAILLSEAPRVGAFAAVEALQPIGDDLLDEASTGLLMCHTWLACKRHVILNQKILAGPHGVVRFKLMALDVNVKDEKIRESFERFAQLLLDCHRTSIDAAFTRASGSLFFTEPVEYPLWEARRRQLIRKSVTEFLHADSPADQRAAFVKYRERLRSRHAEIIMDSYEARMTNPEPLALLRSKRLALSRLFNVGPEEDFQQGDTPDRVAQRTMSRLFPEPPPNHGDLT